MRNFSRKAGTKSGRLNFPLQGEGESYSTVTPLALIAPASFQVHIFKSR
jgi:hypothetical protein